MRVRDVEQAKEGSGCWSKHLLDGCTPVFSCDTLCCIVEEGDSIWIAGESNVSRGYKTGTREGGTGDASTR